MSEMHLHHSHSHSHEVSDELLHNVVGGTGEAVSNSGMSEQDASSPNQKKVKCPHCGADVIIPYTVEHQSSPVAFDNPYSFTYYIVCSKCNQSFPA